MNRGCWVLVFCAWVTVYDVEARVLVQLDSLLSKKAQHALISLIEAADAADSSVNEVYTSCLKSGIPVKKITVTERADRTHVYKVVCDTPLFRLATPVGLLAQTASCPFRCRQDFFEPDVVKKLVECSIVSAQIAPCIDWLKRQDSLFLQRVLIVWQGLHYISISPNITKSSSIDCIIDNNQNIADFWEQLLFFSSQKGQFDFPIVDLRYDGMSVLRGAQKNKKGGAS